MEATKKKKAYLKPEMNRFNMKMEATFLVGSKEIIFTPDNPEEDWTKIGYIEEECTKNGVAKALDPGQSICFRANKDDEGKCQLLRELGVSTVIGDPNNIVKITNIDNVNFRAEISPILCK